MLKIYVFLCLIGFVLADSNDEGQIHFTIGHYQSETGHTYLTCEVEKKEYTVHEGEQYKIVVNYWNHFKNKPYFVNDVTCENKNKPGIVLAKKVNKSISTFTAQTWMRDNWNCTVFTHKNIEQFLPRVKHPIYTNDTFAGAYCSMKINVARRESPPQTILVNNMVLPIRFNHRSKVSYLWTAKYRYGDGDLVNATCANFQNTDSVTISYFFADNLSDLFNSSEETKSVAAGFITEMHDEHNGSVMTCSCKGQGDHTLVVVMVTFILGNFKYNNQMTVKINGKYLRYYVADNNSFSEIEYKSTRGEFITVVCEKKDPNTVLQILEAKNLSGATQKNSSMTSTILFESSENVGKKFRCGLDSENKGQIVLIEIKFSIGELKISADLHPIDVQLEPKSIALELYYYRKLRVIYYDFEVGQTLNVVCKKLFEKNVPIMKLKLEYPAENIDKLYPQEARNISHSFELNEKNEATKISCQLREMAGNDESKLIREIRVILREKQITTTSTTTTTTSMPVDPPLIYKIVAVVVSVVSIIICVTTAVIKMKKKSQVQGGPHNPNYENLQNPRDPTIPAYPPQWDNQYAVPVDRRSENTTYSVPFTEPAYAEAIPKSQRNRNVTDPTYAVLDIKNQPQKNVYKETDDPNYSEVYATRKEQCYAEVLPKVLRDKFKKDNNPYVNVGNESPYANAGEPMYCEPNVSRDNGTYANVNNGRYANSRPNEYVEPTYCEPPKPMARGKKNKR
ncbi:uncharacterized protein LOC124643696 isoform X2 [Helicoverpa zea]|uniref:uncharacterized protein LOC124643696 isoform X2 n=1 Tax=Helicoverpa zea TaxID=7113 RepID=UPI001F5A9D50|nr:uncharacterized protein LOC124643696 isoform X2 [Helicoverpa zea]